MAKGWKSVIIPEKLYTDIRDYYDRHRDSLKEQKIPNFSAYIRFILSKWMYGEEKGEFL